MQITIVNQTRLPLNELALQKIFLQLHKKLTNAANLKNKARLKKTEVTVVLVSSQVMKKLNDQFRQKDYATDVLSFSPVEKNCLGELVFCPTVLKKQARQNNHPLDHEILYMLVHGLLHLLGYDHEISAVEAKKMFFLQDRLFRQLTAGKINLKLTHVNRRRTK